MTEIFRVKDQDRIALDFAGSARSYDDDGHLHVKRTPISKAAVNEYLGSEIPRGKELGLEPNRRYKLLRDPEELKKAASTFNNKPLLFDHNPVTADAHDHDRTVGGLSNPEFEHPYLFADLACWSGPAIKKIDDGSQKEISSAYRYDADMTPGEFEGVAYDGVMRNIRCNHVSLVKKGRAGPDVVVADSAIAGPSHRIEIKIMKKPTVVSALAQGFASQFARTKIATDASIDVAPIFEGLTKKNFAGRKPLLVLGMKGSLHGLAKDEDMADVESLVDQIEVAVENLSDAVDDAKGDAPEGEPGAEDDATNAELISFLDGKLSEEDMAKVKEMLDGPDENPMPPAQDVATGAKNLTKGLGLGKDAAIVVPAKTVAPKLPANLVTKPALDSAIATARAEERENAKALREAEAFVRPFAGNLPAMDSAEDVYRGACDVLKIPHRGVHASALKTLIEMKTKPSDAKPAPKRVAMDAAATSEVSALFPNMNRISA